MAMFVSVTRSLYVMLQSNNDVDIVPKTSVAGTMLF